MIIIEAIQAANLREFCAFVNPRFEGGIPDFMDGILDFMENFNNNNNNNFQAEILISIFNACHLIQCGLSLVHNILEVACLQEEVSFYLSFFFGGGGPRNYFPENFYNLFP